MDFSKLYNIYSDAMDWGKMVVFKTFLNTLKGSLPLAIFFTYLLVRKIKKTVIAFIEYFI